mmetsp:Transcript_28648/g.59030  ORF Transcript_28648/g.59030 Transcript_28648/m.59030 type:complete len:201 (+) Transcript_28648:106-708(+)
MFNSPVSRHFRSNAANSNSSTASRQQSFPLKKSNFKSALERIKIPDRFFSGINVFKVGSNGKLEAASLTLSQDRFIISILPRATPRQSNGSSSGSLLRPSVLRNRIKSAGSTGGDSVDGGASDAGSIVSYNQVSDRVDIGSIDRIQSGLNTLRFEMARYVVFFGACGCSRIENDQLLTHCWLAACFRKTKRKEDGNVSTK